jgi:hypothetical protein
MIQLDWAVAWNGKGPQPKPEWPRENQPETSTKEG